jgi:putative membrane protein
MRAAAIAIALSLPAFAHEGRRFEAQDLLTEWVWDPLIVLPIVVAALFYARGARRASGLERWEQVCFWLGWITLVIGLLSPLHPMGEALFSAHMAQHELLMVIAAPLLILGRPLVAFLWAVPDHWRRASGVASRAAGGAWSMISAPLAAFLIHFVVIWAWHIPRAYQASVTNPFIHALQHISFLGSALLFWWSVLRQHQTPKHYGPGLFYIFATAAHTSVLGALLAFTTTPWYPVYAETVEAWGLSPIEDQQLGGFIMWIPPAFVYLAAFLWIFMIWMQGSSARRVAQGTALAALVLLTSSCNRSLVTASNVVSGADPQKGKQYMAAYGCGSCHTIPGVSGATGTVGPPLTKIAVRTYLAGRITNTPENMVRWIHNPKSVDDQTAMPVTGITEQEAREVVRYLYTLK